MIKKVVVGSLVLSLSALLAFSAVTGVQAASSGRYGRPAAGQGGRAGVTPPAAPAAAPQSGAALPAADPAGLDQAERDALVFMREEEKLARDVYAALYTQWGAATFQNISQSEQAHMDALLVLLNRYGIADPASAQAGVFTNPTLQALYTDLVARGSQSLAEALKVGGAIEEIDIRDLDQRLAQTDQADIQPVYGSLRAGSENHLRAFTQALTMQAGETYQPQVLSADAYQTILAGSAGNGAGGNRGGGRP